MTHFSICQFGNRIGVTPCQQLFFGLIDSQNLRYIFDNLYIQIEINLII